ncbi:ABC transporter ATP-binding protein [Alphaproteobacteria bacterium]|nr:ABC transporter ATP-binding protein [Alphaproteobacteria bacterium]
MIEVKDLLCRYGDITAIRGINFILEKGETMALVGPNGAGKTTLLMALAGHVQCQSGQINFNGAKITDTEPVKRCLNGIGLVPEGRRIFPDLTVLENLQVGGYSRPTTEQPENLQNVFDIFPRLQDRQKQLAGSLSGGEQQMLAFGRAMMSRPRLMLVDELSLGLMPSVVDECYDALKKLQSEGIAIILVDQNSDASMAFCSSTLIMESGYQIWHGASDKAPESSIY